MSENKTLTVVDINAGLGGRSLVFNRLGAKVLLAVENDDKLRYVFNQLNPNIPCINSKITKELLDCIPQADILSANLRTEFYSLSEPVETKKQNAFEARALTNLLSEIILRDAPKAFIFQATTTFLRRLNSGILTAAAMRRYSLSYQVFSESDHSGYRASGTQVFFIGIRNDLALGGFYLSLPFIREQDIHNVLEAPSNIDSWYRSLPHSLSVPSLELTEDTFYSKNYGGGIIPNDRVNLNALMESFYCDALGLRRLTHNEYAAIKGYADTPVNFNLLPLNKRLLYRMLFGATNIYLFEDVFNSLVKVLHGCPDRTNMHDWSSYTKYVSKDTKTEKKTKKEVRATESLIKPRNRLVRLHIDQLKGLQNLDITFTKNLTAVMGINCSGKSTVLHALACVFQPVELGQDHPFNFFFTPHSDASWNGSRLTVDYLDENTQTRLSRIYQKKSDRWSPQYSKRPKREVFFIGIESCLPEIEKERQKSYISYSTNVFDDKNSKRIREMLSIVMDKDYTQITNNKTSKKSMIGVRTSNDIRYSALSMGAGEQRTFKILQTVNHAPPFSLILIDEIDLLLHVKALERLVKLLSEIASNKKLQIVFTTHSLAMRNLTDFVDIRYLFQAPDQTMVFDAITPDIVYNLTNESEIPFTVYVEDDLAEAAVSNIVGELGMSRHVSVKTVGSAENAFTLAAGLFLQDDKLLDSSLIVLDGDVYRSDEEKRKQILRKLTGTETDHDAKVERVLSAITEFCLPDKTSPEKYIHEMITKAEPLTNKDREIMHCANEITVVKNSHEWLNGIIERMNRDRGIMLFQIVEIASRHQDWQGYASNLYSWLKKKKEECGR